MCVICSVCCCYRHSHTTAILHTVHTSAAVHRIPALARKSARTPRQPVPTNHLSTRANQTQRVERTVYVAAYGTHNAHVSSHAVSRYAPSAHVPRSVSRLFPERPAPRTTPGARRHDRALALCMPSSRRPSRAPSPHCTTRRPADQPSRPQTKGVLCVSSTAAAATLVLKCHRPPTSRHAHYLSGALCSKV